jgi:hypothetical protein
MRIALFTDTWSPQVNGVVRVLLGLESVLVFVPTVSAAELLEIGGSPSTELFRSAMPLTVLFILLSAAGISRLWGRSVLDYVSGLLACTTVVVLLGFNLSILGLVRFTSGSVPLLGMTYGLVVVLNVVFAAVFLALERRAIFGTVDVSAAAKAVVS